MCSLKCSPNWVEELSYDETITVLKDLAWSHIQEAGPYRDTLGDLLRASDWVGLCNFELQYADNDDPVHLQHARQALAFFQKWEKLDLGIDKERVAFEKFINSERQCRETNRILRMQRKGEFTFSPFVNSVFHTASRRISAALGPVPSLDQLEFGFGPGATTTTKARSLNWAVKLRSDLECSSGLVQSLNAIAQQAPHWFFLHAHACNSDVAFTDVKVGVGRLQFVPKNAKTYRSIMVEPILNGFFQRGVGKYIRQRLKRFGVDLDDQSRNQQLAKVGSIDGSLATIDLSSASDTISLELVYELLPLDWASFLATGRTSRVSYKGIENPLHLEKFSSMGNGYTFELESLIFWALAGSVLDLLGIPKDSLAVYGDDIVLPVTAVDRLKEVFRAAGFTVNSEKSFVSGYFRESCGKDYFRGTDIRPFYQKRNVSGETLFTLHNFYMREFDFARAKKVRKYIHPSLRIFGPDGYGDGHLIGSWAPKGLKRREERHGWECVRFETFRHGRRYLKRVPSTDWALPTYCIYVRQGAETGYDSRIVAGSNGFERISVYTHQRSVFARW